ncbi:MAG: PilZ domain-containing protein [Deltaproteobacteria bacterium]|nr:PilZ domain-containing protein [Deltaproteobacteria bacterium]
MWLKRSAPKKNKRRFPRIEIPFKRARAEIRRKLNGETTASRVFLSDISITGVGLFAEAPLPSGEHVTLTVLADEPLVIRGVVVWCSPYTLNMKILSTESFTYRMGIRFEFNSSQEVYEMMDYCTRLRTPAPPAN